MRGLRAGVALMGAAVAMPAAADLFGAAEYARAGPSPVAALWQPAASGAAVQPFRFDVARAADLPLTARLDAVNRLVNAVPYREDRANYGVADRWATPAEFAARGGDCEDYAIAKYALLKAAGVSAAAMRIVVVRDLEKDGGPHAVLAVADGATEWILDNQATEVADGRGDRYAPVYAVNELGWSLFLPSER